MQKFGKTLKDNKKYIKYLIVKYKELKKKDKNKIQNFKVMDFLNHFLNLLSYRVTCYYAN